MTSDYELYINTIQCINNNELDKAWGIIQSFNSKELKDSFTKDNTKHNSIMYDVIYEGCDGNLHPELFTHILNCICKWLCIIRQLQS